jgi:ribosomal protein L31
MDNKIINNKYDTAPTFNDTKDSVNVTSPLSKAYVLVDVKEVYRPFYNKENKFSLNTK